MNTNEITDIVFSSLETIPQMNCSALFTTDSSQVFRDSKKIVPVQIGNKGKYIPWGADNQRPYDILRLIDHDETLSTCQTVNAEVLYGGGIDFDCEKASGAIQEKVEQFVEHNDLCSYYLGVCQDLKHFGFAVSVIILNKQRNRILRIVRKEACYCRFAEADSKGMIPFIYYADWYDNSPSAKEVEKIPLLDPRCPIDDLNLKIKETTKMAKFAVLTRIPSPDSTYYPRPYYFSLFRGKWYNIKQFIGVAKESKLKNAAPIKYHIRISQKYWDSIFRAEGITNRAAQRERVAVEKQHILDFLTGAENSGKAWFSTFYVNPDGKSMEDVIIEKVESGKEGGDWQADIQEAVNMICFTMRVHSNLVGSVPGKAQSNNSGSDKRELYTIAQATQKPYRDLLFKVFRLIISFNGWHKVKPKTEIVQLTTLDNHTDTETIKTE